MKLFFLLVSVPVNYVYEGKETFGWEAEVTEDSVKRVNVWYVVGGGF